MYKTKKGIPVVISRIPAGTRSIGGLPPQPEFWAAQAGGISGYIARAETEAALIAVLESLSKAGHLRRGIK